MLPLFFKALADSIGAAGSNLRADFDLLCGTAALMVVVDAVFHIAFYMVDRLFILTVIGHETFLLQFVGILTCSVTIISAGTAVYVGF